MISQSLVAAVLPSASPRRGRSGPTSTSRRGCRARSCSPISPTGCTGPLSCTSTGCLHPVLRRRDRHRAGRHQPAAPRRLGRHLRARLAGQPLPGAELLASGSSSRTRAGPPPTSSSTPTWARPRRADRRRATSSSWRRSASSRSATSGQSTLDETLSQRRVTLWQQQHGHRGMGPVSSRRGARAPAADPAGRDPRHGRAVRAVPPDAARAQRGRRCRARPPSSPS